MVQGMADFVAAYLDVGTVRGAARVIGKSPSVAFSYMRDERVKEAIRLGGVPEGAIAPAHNIRKATARVGRQRKAKEINEQIAEIRDVAATYDVSLGPLVERLTYDRMLVLNRLSAIAEANITDLFKMRKTAKGPQLVMKRLEEIPRHLSYAISKIRVSRGGTIEVTMEPKLRALAMLHQATGAGSEEQPIGGEVNDPDMTIEARLQTYDNVVSPSFRPRPADSA
jgi:hypothetical protein